MNDDTPGSGGVVTDKKYVPLSIACKRCIQSCISEHPNTQKVYDPPNVYVTAANAKTSCPRRGSAADSMVCDV